MNAIEGIIGKDLMNIIFNYLDHNHKNMIIEYIRGNGTIQHLVGHQKYSMLSLDTAKIKNNSITIDCNDVSLIKTSFEFCKISDTYISSYFSKTQYINNVHAYLNIQKSKLYDVSFTNEIIQTCSILDCDLNNCSLFAIKSEFIYFGRCLLMIAMDRLIDQKNIIITFNIDKSVLYKSQLSHCDISGFTITKSTIDDTTIDNTNINSLQIQNTKLTKSTIEDIDCTVAYMANNCWKECTIKNIIFKNIHLENNKFGGCKISNQTINYGRIINTIFDYVDMDVVWNECNIQKTQFNNTVMSGVINNTHFKNIKFDTCDIGVRFNNCVLANCIFKNILDSKKILFIDCKFNNCNNIENCLDNARAITSMH